MTFHPRRLGVVAAAALLVATAACSSGEDGAERVDTEDKMVGAMADYGVGQQFTATEPLTFSLLYNDHPNYPVDGDWMLWSELAERTGVTLDLVTVPLSDYAQKRSLLIGSGEAPLIISKTYPGEESAFTSSGAVLPVSEYLDLMPNLSAKIEQWEMEPELASLRQADGEFYVLPGVHQEPWQDYTMAVRTDVMDDLGLAEPTTWEEFRDVLRAVKEEYPDTYPLSDRFSESGTPAGNLQNLVAMTYGTSAGWGYNSAQWDAEADAFEFTGTTPEFKAYVEYMHSLVEEGLLDPESFTQDDDSAIAEFTSGRSFAISTNAQSIVNDYRGPLEDNVEGGEVAKITLPGGPVGQVVPGSTRLENGLMISSAAAERDDFVAMMQFIDWLWYSDEGQEFAKWGVDGTTYTKDGGDYQLAEDVDYVGLNPGASKHLQSDFGFAGGVFAYGGTTELLQSTFSQEELDFQDAMAAKTALPEPPPAPLTEAEREQVTLVETPLQDFVNQASLQFILGQRDLADWDAYVTEAEGKGVDGYLQTMNEAQQRFASENPDVDGG